MGTRILAAALALGLACASARAAMPPPLVAGCDGCHGGGAPRSMRLAGASAAGIVAAVSAFRDDSRPATVMGRIARGFSDQEIATIAAWYAAQQ